MRGERERQANIMLAVTPETFVPEDHPLRRIKALVDECLQQLSPRFEAMYAKRGRPSILPEHLLKASLLIALYSVRSERPVLRATALQPALQVVPRSQRRRGAL